MKSAARAAYVWVAWLFVACCLVQVFLAGLGVFENPARFADHRNFGYLFGLLTIVLIVLAIAGTLGRLVIGLSILLLVQFAMQSVFVLARASSPMFAAFHPVNGFLIILVAILAARLAQARRRAQTVPDVAPSTADGSVQAR